MNKFMFIKKIKRCLSTLFCLSLLGIICLSQMASAKTIQANDSTTLYYEESGSGDPIIFIPGWTASHEFFNRQVPYFNKNYHVIAMDPRGQGLSQATLDHNNYKQHGEDLAHLIDALNLKNITLIGWSFGCFDAYAYIRLKGINNLKTFVCIDASPHTDGSSWRSRASLHKADLIQQMENRYQFAPLWAQSMVDHKLTSSELSWIVNESLRTPSYVALLLLFDALNSDYTPEAVLLDKSRIPTINFVSEPMASSAKIWLKTHAPHAKIIIMGEKHMAFWEYSDRFNNDLENFLTQQK